MSNNPGTVTYGEEGVESAALKVTQNIFLVLSFTVYSTEAVDRGQALEAPQAPTSKSFAWNRRNPKKVSMNRM